MYKLTKAEVQSGVSRVKHAEGLILQLPLTHEGRGTWLLNYGVSLEAIKLRRDLGIMFVRETEAAATINDG